MLRLHKIPPSPHKKGAIRALFAWNYEVGFEPERRGAADIVRRGDQWSPEGLQLAGFCGRAMCLV